MRHPTEGVLRRLLDEPAGVADHDRAHVADCPQCLDLLAEVRADAEHAGQVLAAGPAPDVDAAWARLSGAGAPGRAPAPHRRRRGLLHRPVAAGLAAAVVLAGAGTAAAGGWLPIFRTEAVAPVAFSTSDLVALPDLSAYGELEVEDAPDVREVPDAAAAEAATGLDVPEVADLPRGLTGEPRYQVADAGSLVFTFSAERAARAAETAGGYVPPVPAGLDGSRVRLVAGPGLAQVWQSASGAPGLVVGRAVAPTAESDGVPFETVRDYLLSLPGLPDGVAAQLRAFTADGSTLPLPAPSDYVRSSQVDVDGAEATLLETRDRALAAVVWVDDGEVTAVAGSLGDDEVLEVARGLR